MGETRVHVIKLGGSLLELVDVTARFERYRERFGSGRDVLIVGGGGAADTVRFFDCHVGFDETTGHWLAVRAMQLHAHVLAAAMPAGRLVESLDECDAAWQANKLAILDPLGWLEGEEQAGRGVPHRWQFTSDSIAARAAAPYDQAQLSLLKSTCPHEPCSLQRAAEEGIVDRCFPRTAAGLASVTLVNLRDSAMPQCRLHHPRATGKPRR